MGAVWDDGFCTKTGLQAETHTVDVSALRKMEYPYYTRAMQTSIVFFAEWILAVGAARSTAWKAVPVVNGDSKEIADFAPGQGQTARPPGEKKFG